MPNSIKPKLCNGGSAIESRLITAANLTRLVIMKKCVTLKESSDALLLGALHRLGHNPSHPVHHALPTHPCQQSN